MQWFTSQNALLRDRKELAFAGVYAVAIPKDTLEHPWAMIRNDKWLVYVGKSDNDLGERLRHHVFSSSAYSRLRQSLGLLTVYQRSKKIIAVKNSFHFGSLEADLTEILTQKALLFGAFCKNPQRTEEQLIAALDSELNMTSRYYSPSAVLLRRLRAEALSRHVKLIAH